MASTHQWDGETSQREAPGGLSVLPPSCLSSMGSRYKVWLKSPALESGLRSPVSSCATLRKLISLPGPHSFPTVKCVRPQLHRTCGKPEEPCQSTCAQQVMKRYSSLPSIREKARVGEVPSARCLYKLQGSSPALTSACFSGPA